MSSELASRYIQAMRRISAQAGGPGKVTLIAVSKTQPVEAIETLYHLGHRDFGENYVQELVEKAEKLREAGCEGIRWHFIGHLQSNKVKALIPIVHAVHSVDSARLAEELAKRWKQAGREGRLPCFVEVNIDHEASKSGVMPEDAAAVAAQVAALPELELEGLMAIPASVGGAADALQAFAALHDLEQRCRPHTTGKLSMGMSDDYELAITQGATHVRLGTALFGSRRAAAAATG
jgi:pyridoxal phosphate enzyme (YggS family)